MNPYNPAAVQTVWNRVLNSDNINFPRPLEEALKTMIDEERADSATYYALARRAGRNAAALHKIATQEAAHARRLAALYYLLTGKEHCTRSVMPRLKYGLREELRIRYREEQQGSKAYQEAIQMWPEYVQLFRSLQLEEEEHACAIHEIIQTMLQC